MKILFSSLILFSSFCLSAHADDGFGANAGVNVGFGQMYNSTKTIPLRTMGTVALHALPGYHVGNWLFGPFLEVRFVGQRTEPSEVANQNLKGSGYVLGVGAMYKGESWKFEGSLDFIGKHSLSLADGTGKQSVYQKPRGAHVLVGYDVLQYISLDASLSYEAYNSNLLSGAFSDISDNKLTHWNAAIGASYSFL